MPSEQLAIFLAQNSATSRCENDIFFLYQFGQDFGFTLAKSTLSLNLENNRNLNTGSFLDFMIGINKFPVECMCQGFADGGFACAHHADQDNIGLTEFALNGLECFKFACNHSSSDCS